MTLIAGIVSRRPGVSVPADVCETLRRSISRHPDDAARTFGNERAFFAKLDTGAFGEPAEVVDKRGSVTLVTGEPLLLVPGQETVVRGRAADTQKIHNALTRNDTSVLAAVTGVFNAVHYQPSTGELLLIAGKLGIRPLYYYLSDEFVIFAGAIRILEEVAAIPKTMDVRAVTEIICLAYALYDRTPYVGIKALRAAEIIRVGADKLTSERYVRWDKTAPSTASEPELVEELYRRFDIAVARRIGSDSTTAAYLSGGLDSRCIVASLRSRDVSVHTFNFARPGTQDRAFGREFARAVGATHWEIAKQAGDLTPDYSQLLADAWSGQASGARAAAERPDIVWSGEGGSVTLGHVGPTERSVELIRGGDLDRTVQLHLEIESAQLPMRLFRRELARDMAETLHEGIKEEIGRYEHPDPGRNLYLFVHLNEQHRKLTRHFETIDLHRLEFQLPFFDSPFFELIVSAPLDLCLSHKLYVKWLDLFQPAVTAVPWQAYPGHVPCLLPAAKDLDFQWDPAYQASERAARKELVMAQARELRRGQYLPQELLSKWNLRLASMVHATGLRDYGYLIGPAHLVHTYAQKCCGQYALPEEAGRRLAG